MDINSITQVNDNGTNREDMRMKNASQLDYNIIDEYKDFLQILALVLLIILLVCMVKHLEFQENILIHRSGKIK